MSRVMRQPYWQNGKIEKQGKVEGKWGMVSNFWLKKGIFGGILSHKMWHSIMFLMVDQATESAFYVIRDKETDAEWDWDTNIVPSKI